MIDYRGISILIIILTDALSSTELEFHNKIKGYVDG